MRHARVPCARVQTWGNRSVPAQMWAQPVSQSRRRCGHSQSRRRCGPEQHLCKVHRRVQPQRLAHARRRRRHQLRRAAQPARQQRQNLPRQCGSPMSVMQTGHRRRWATHADHTCLHEQADAHAHARTRPHLAATALNSNRRRAKHRRRTRSAKNRSLPKTILRKESFFRRCFARAWVSSRALAAHRLAHLCRPELPIEPTVPANGRPAAQYPASTRGDHRE